MIDEMVERVGDAIAKEWNLKYPRASLNAAAKAAIAAYMGDASNRKTEEGATIANPLLSPAKLAKVRSILLWAYNNTEFEPCVAHRKKQMEEAIALLDEIN